MMYKHLEDKGDINVLINTDGNAVLVCSKCGHQWLGSYKPIIKTPTQVRESFFRVLSKDQDLVRSMNIDMGKL